MNRPRIPSRKPRAFSVHGYFAVFYIVLLGGVRKVDQHVGAAAGAFGIGVTVMRRMLAGGKLHVDAVVEPDSVITGRGVFVLFFEILAVVFRIGAVHVEAHQRLEHDVSIVGYARAVHVRM